MPRQKTVVDLSTGTTQVVDFTAEEEAAADAAEAAWNAGAADRRKVEIKQEAYDAIVAQIPEWKQRNLIARSVELTEKKFDTSLTAEEQTELDALKVDWGWVKQVRANSDAAEALCETQDPETVVLSIPPFPGSP